MKPNETKEWFKGSRRCSHMERPTLVNVTSAPSLLTFREQLKLHLFRLSCPGLVL